MPAAAADAALLLRKLFYGEALQTSRVRGLT